MQPIDLISTFADAARIRPNVPFLTTDRGVLTYGEVLRQIPLLAAMYREMGLGIGDRVIIAANDERTAMVLFLSLIRCGITAILASPDNPAPEARSLIDAARPKGLFIDEALHKNWNVQQVPKLLLINETSGKTTLFGKLLGNRGKSPSEACYPAILERLTAAPLPEAIPPETDAYIIFTSGTTARPKGVRISHRALFAHLQTLTRQFGYDRKTRLLNLLPLHHADGLVQGPLSGFFAGGTVYRHLRFSIPAISDILDTIFTERITHFVAVPTMLALIMSMTVEGEDCFTSPEFRLIISTAAKLEPSLWEGFEARFGKRIVNVYGLTETVAGSLFSGPDEGSHRIGTVGKPVDCLVRLVNEEGAEVARGEIGELLLSGPHLMTGYFDDPEATDDAIRNGWLHTGDLARQDEDSCYRIMGRRKNLIIAGGLNIQPEEVTEVLHGHPAVQEAVTFGMPDEIWGERVVSCVIPRAEGALDEAGLIEYCRGRLAPYKLPSRIHFAGELPKGPSGKVLIDRARELASLPPVERNKPARVEIPERIIAIASECFKTSACALSLASGQSTTPGWDSLGHLEFVVELENTFGISLSPADIMKLTSLGEAERIVRSHG
jgi:long-chain acyl-CoA synthetase